jgi:hypothetical protein
MTHKELLKLFTTHDIDFVVIGGLALRLYNSPRLTHDIDIAIRTLDVDRVIELMYRNSYLLINDVQDKSLTVALTYREAQEWVGIHNAGSLSFIIPVANPSGLEIPMEKIDLSSQVDVLFELGVPIMRLIQNSRMIQLQDISFRVASREDLITLKKQRSDKSPADEDDIRYLESLNEEQGNYS